MIIFEVKGYIYKLKKGKIELKARVVGAYINTGRRMIEETLFAMVYGLEVVLPNNFIHLMIHATQVE